MVEVVDDGIGGADPRGSASGLSDRVAALGGMLALSSEPGRAPRSAEIPRD